MGKLKIREMTLFALLGAMTFGAKYAMAGLPNIEPVTLLVTVFAVTFGKKAVWPIYVYVGLELLFYGPGIWNIVYLYIWLVPAGLAWKLRDMESALGWAVVSGAFGLAFGALCLPVDLVIGGWAYAAAKWVSGIPFDAAHCVGNFVMALVGFRPVRRLLTGLQR